jgi:hypothetical protein
VIGVARTGWLRKLYKKVVIPSPKWLEDAEDDLQELKIKIFKAHAI